MIQTPTRCLDGMDKALLILAGLSLIGVAFGIVIAYKYGNKVFNQSHTSGRTATIFSGKTKHGFFDRLDGLRPPNPDKQLRLIACSVREMRMGNPMTGDGTDDMDRNKSEFGGQLHPRIWLGGISQTSILARIEKLQRKKSKNESFDISIGSSTTNTNGTEKSTTNCSATSEHTTNETIK